jgi:hypothetical protein
MQFVAHLDAAIRRNEAIVNVWEEGDYCLEMSRLKTEYHDIYLKMSTAMDKPKKYYCVRCTHMKKDQTAGIEAPKVHCAKMKHRCLRFCAGQAEQYRSVADFKYSAERRACYEQGLPLVWPSVCACDLRNG